MRLNEWDDVEARAKGKALYLSLTNIPTYILHHVARARLAFPCRRQVPCMVKRGA